VRNHGEASAVPLRPLTTGELLDAAVVVLRTRTGRLIQLGAVVALGEQAVLFPLRRLADVDSSFLPATGRLGIFGVLAVVGFATEAFAIGLLGGVAARLAPRVLLGPGTPPRPARTPSVVAVAALAGVVCGASAWLFLVLPVPLQSIGLFLALVGTYLFWPFAYGLVGLAAPVVVVDRRGPAGALLRSVRLAGRNGMRAAWIRVLGYLVWLLVRLGLGLATVALVELFFSSPSATVDNLIMGAAWLVVNALAYPVLGCLDVALHLEARMRTEGLDIALRRSVRRGVTPEAVLAVPGPASSGLRSAGSEATRATREDDALLAPGPARAERAQRHTVPGSGRGGA